MASEGEIKSIGKSLKAKVIKHDHMGDYELSERLMKESFEQRNIPGSINIKVSKK
jgi:hypothetical protein